MLLTYANNFYGYGYGGRGLYFDWTYLLVLAGLVPVSYTHLDVYKRQIWRLWPHVRSSMSSVFCIFYHQWLVFLWKTERKISLGPEGSAAVFSHRCGLCVPGIIDESRSGVEPVRSV